MVSGKVQVLCDVGATVSAEIISLGISHRITWNSKWNEWFEKTKSHRYGCDNQCGYFSIESGSRTPKYRYGTTTYKHFWKIWFFISAELILRKWLRSLRRNRYVLARSARKFCQFSEAISKNRTSRNFFATFERIFKKNNLASPKKWPRVKGGLLILTVRYHTVFVCDCSTPRDSQQEC